MLTSNISSSLTISISSSHLTVSALPARILERNYYGEVKVLLQNYRNLQLEFVRAGSGCDNIPELSPVCFVKTSGFTPDQAWPRTCVVWTKLTRGEEGEGTLGTILAYLHHSGKCLLLQVRISLFLSLFPELSLFLFSGSSEQHCRHVLQLGLHSRPWFPGQT